MRTSLRLVVIPLVALVAAAAIHAQIANPIPAPIVKRGLTVEVRDVVRLPETRGLRPADQDVTPAGWARVSFVRDLPDGRRFANDSRGFLYLLDRNNQPSRLRERRRRVPVRRLQPARERLHRVRLPPRVRAERAVLHGARASARWAIPRRRTSSRRGSRRPTSNFHNVITEWHATNPAANTFEGTRRELLRVGHIVTTLDAPVRRRRVQPDGEARLARLRPALHERQRSGVQQRRRAEREQSRPDAAPRHGRSAPILRIDPRSPSVSGGTKGLGDYTIPPINKFAADGDPKTLGEIYAYGFRNAHRLSWDLTDGTMFASRHRHEQHRGDQHRPRGRATTAG